MRLQGRYDLIPIMFLLSGILLKNNFEIIVLCLVLSIISGLIVIIKRQDARKVKHVVICMIVSIFLLSFVLLHPMIMSWLYPFKNTN